ncbi:nuclear transport factor 2 family protein [soil metagenome]
MADPAIEALERRLSKVEDELAIHSLLASYGPLADAGLGADAAALWTEDGAYDPGGVTRAEGTEAITAIYVGDRHQGLITAGSMHMTAPVQVTLDGDQASAVGYSILAVNRDGRFTLARASINRWTLTRTAAGWRIAERINRVLDGSAEAEAILASVAR